MADSLGSFINYMTLPVSANAVPFDTGLMDRLAGAVADPGFGVFPELLAADLGDALRRLLQEKIAADALVRAGVGKIVKVHSEIRTDSIFWLESEDSSPTAQIWLESMNLLCSHFRASLFLPVWSYEGHLARYPEGGFYKPHLDQHQHSLARQITMIAYLNEDWTALDGGQLRLFTDPAQGLAGPSIEVMPHFGTVVIFRSADFWHEVLPAKRSRFSLTGWLRGREEILL